MTIRSCRENSVGNLRRTEISQAFDLIAKKYKFLDGILGRSQAIDPEYSVTEQTLSNCCLSPTFLTFDTFLAPSPTSRQFTAKEYLEPET